MATNSDLKKFAQSARRQLREQVAGRLEQVLGVDSVEVREKKNAVDQLKKQIAEHGKAEVIDKVAYIWFNRFCALRYMDVNLYNPVRVVSPAPGNIQPELLQEAKAGYLPEEWKKFIDSEKVFGLLNGSIRAENGQQDAYQRLLVGVCNAYARIMPFMFEAIEDYTELLIPLDLLSENSVLYQTREALSEETCQDVEVIGWLYQYYISERKDEVFEQVKKGNKVDAEDIPAVTQLFTPHWIVRYLVENSLGRLWLLNHPDSKITEKMEYYIKPVDEETDFLKVSSPEELKICDPACGSGHMLTYAFDLLVPIYEEQGFDPTTIPSLILQKNLYGIEIDGRAGALSAFALFMKARSKDKRFFTRNIQPNICVMENVTFTDQEVREYIHAVGRDLFTEPLIETLRQFDESKNFGSLIQPILTNPGYVRETLSGRNLEGNILLYGVHEKVLKILEYSEYLSLRYQIVIANPPYMGISNANDEIKEFAKNYFPNSKSDLFAMFIERNFSFIFPHGIVGMITMQSWMFLASFSKLREIILTNRVIVSMAHLGARAFDSIGGEIVSTAAFILSKNENSKYKSTYLRLTDFNNEVEKSNALKTAIDNQKCGWLFQKSATELKKIPNNPIAYWVNDDVGELFTDNPRITDDFDFRIGMVTGSNERYVRNWSELSFGKIGLNLESREYAKRSGKKWFPYANGGVFRKYFGNEESVVNWENDGQKLQSTLDPTGSRVWGHNFNLDCIFKPAVCWNSITTGVNGFIFHDAGFLFDSAAGLGQPKGGTKIENGLGYLNSRVASFLLPLLNPTINLPPGYLGALPFKTLDCSRDVKETILLSKIDWESYEYSWNFTRSPFIEKTKANQLVSDSYEIIKRNWIEMVTKVRNLETTINKLFIQEYGFYGSLSEDVKLEDVTLTCNPNYRYGPGKTEEEYERLQRADTMKEFISYAVGCMFGRYSLDKPGLILANQGETLQDYLRHAPDPTFLPDEDNVIPVIGGDWFEDDISARFKKFLKVTFGEEDYSENLQFIEEAIGRDIESYFLKDFYDYHIKMYKKRPIYWMFSSPKGTFNALIYMHRYNKDTVSILLNEYLKQFRVKLESRKSYAEKLSISASGSQRERTLALKELETLKKQLEEITTYENKVIFPLATKQIEIDLDDGVKANYPKLGEALVPIKGLTDKTE